jgi:BON domain-containing protein
MQENAYVAGQIERAMHGDPRTHELGIRVEADGDDVILRGQVASEERRRLVARVAREQAPGLTVRNEVSVTEVLPPEPPEVLKPPGKIVPAQDVLPPHEASS